MLPFLLVAETGLKKGLLRQGVSVPRRKSWCCRHGPNSLAEKSKHISKEMFSKQIMNLPKLNKCLFDQNPEGHVPQLVFSQSFRIIIDGPKFQCLETVPRVTIGETHSFFLLRNKTWEPPLACVPIFSCLRSLSSEIPMTQKEKKRSTCPGSSVWHFNPTSELREFEKIKRCVWNETGSLFSQPPNSAELWSSSQTSSLWGGRDPPRTGGDGQARSAWLY